MKKLLGKVLAVLAAAALLASVGLVSAFAEDLVLENKTNVALEKEPEVDGTIASLSLEDNNFWGILNLTDGVWASIEKEGTNIGWYGVPTPDELEEGFEIDLAIDLCGKFTVDEIRIFPMLFLNGTNFPSAYTVEVSSDSGKNWTVVGKEEGLDMSVSSLSELAPKVYTFPAMNANYVRLVITGPSKCVMDNNNYIGIGEIEVMGVNDYLLATEVPEETSTPVPTDAPTDVPTDAPTDAPTDTPTAEPTEEAADPQEKTGCGGFVSGGIALLLLAALPVIRKKS